VKAASAWLAGLAILAGCTATDGLVAGPAAADAHFTVDVLDSAGDDAQSTVDAPESDGDDAHFTVDAPESDGDDAQSTVDAPESNGDDAQSTVDAPESNGDDAQSTVDAPESNGDDAQSSVDATGPDGLDADAGVDAVDQCPFGQDPNALCLHWGVCTQGLALTCAGAQVACDYSGVPGYEPVEQSCDGLDNDCNGLIDDDLPAPLASLTVGVCKALKQVCGPKGWQEPKYVALPDFQVTETLCDGLDNDCNGQTDDIPGAVFADEALGVCQGVPLQCQGALGWTLVVAAIPGHEAVETLCDGLDNDCDGKTDADLWTAPFAGGPAVLQAGVCAGAKLHCLGGQWQAPDYTLWQTQLAGYATPTYEPAEASCDGLDNDCDGSTDADLGPGPVASKTLGVCQGQTSVCQGALGWQDPNWYALPGYSKDPEWLCDGVDNDCDGLTDEDAACPLWQSGGRGLGQVALSPDGKRLAWTSLTGVHVLELASGARLFDHFGHGYEVTGVDFSPDGTQVASAGRFDALQVWNAVKPPLPYAGETPVAIQQYGTTYGAVAWAPDGARVAVADQAGNVRLFAVWSGQQIATFSGHKAPVHALAWVLAGGQKNNRLVSGDDAGVLWQWDTLVKGGKLLGNQGAGVTALAADPGSPRVLVTGQDSTPHVWNLDSGKVEVVLQGHTQAVAGGQWTGQPNQVLTADITGEVRQWTLPQPGKPSVTTVPSAQTWLGPTLPAQDLVADLAVQGTEVVAGTLASGPWRLDLQTGAWTQPELRHQGGVRTLTTSQGVLASAGDDALVRLWQGQTGQHLLDLAGHEGPVNGVALTVTAPGLQAGAQVESGSVDFSVRLWQVVPGGLGVLQQKTFGLGGPWPEDLHLAPGNLLWIAGGPGVQAVSLAAGTLGQKVAAYATGFPNLVQSVTPSPDGKKLLLGMTGQGPAQGVHYRLVDGKTLKVLWDVGKLEADRHVAAWRPDGTQVVVSGGAAGLELLDGQTGTLVQELWGHTGAVLALAWADGGTRLVSGSADGTARVWQTLAGKDVQSLAAWTRQCPAPCTLVQVQAVAWLDALGKVGLSAGSDGAVMGWQAP
jgi:WD40 repeat protein